MRKVWILAISLAVAVPAQATVSYDFIPTAAGGVPTAHGPFTDPHLLLTVSDAVYASGSYSYSASNCSVPLLCQPSGDPNGIHITAGLDSWTPLSGTAVVNLSFTPSGVTGSISELGETLDLIMNGASAMDWTGQVQSDSLNCPGIGFGSCTFTGYFAAVPEPGSLGLLLAGLGMILVTRTWLFRPREL